MVTKPSPQGYDDPDRRIGRRVALGTASNYAGKVIALTTWFFLTPFILGHLGAEQYGLWVLGSSVVAYGSLLNLGLSAALIKYVAEFRARGDAVSADALIGSTTTLFTLLGGAALLLSTALALVFPALFHVSPDQARAASWLVFLLGVNIALGIPFAAAHGVLQGLQRYDLATLNSTGNVLLSAAATVAILRAGGGLLGLAASNIAVAIVMQLVVGIMVRHAEPAIRLRPRLVNLGELRRIARFSASLSISHLASRLNNKTDEIVIGASLRVDAVTPYALALKLSEVAGLLAEQFVKVFLPLASELNAADDRDRLRELYLTGTRLVVAIYLAIGIVVVTLSQPILTWWVGAQYAGSAPVVALLSLAGLLAMSQWPAGAILQGMARHGPIALASSAAALLNLALSIVLVRRFGVIGVAIGTLVPTVLNSLGFATPYTLRVLDIRGSRVVREVLVPALLPLAPAVGILAAGTILFHPHGLLSIVAIGGAGLLTYVALYLGFAAGTLERGVCRDLIGAIIRRTARRQQHTP